MYRVLVIESSATLRHVLVRLLREHGFAVEQSDTSSGLSLLKQHSVRSGYYSAIVVGWPGYFSAEDEQLLTVLDASYKNHPVLVVGDEAHPGIHTWISSRLSAEFIYWNNYTDAVGIIKGLLDRNRKIPKGETIALNNAIRILFVDDSKSVRTYYQRLLSRNGYHVTLAEDMYVALEKAHAESFDIAIIDYYMPNGNGDELCRALRENKNTAQITTAIFTGTYVDKAIQEALEAGASECMFKNEVDALFLARINAMSRLVKARKSTESERKRLESILSSVGDGVYGVNTAGKITFMNPAARRILGFSLDESLIGKCPHEMFHYADENGDPVLDRKNRLLQAYQNGDELHGWETVFWHQNRNSIAIECTVYPHMVENQVRGSIVAFRDISERKILENRLRWQASHDALTELYNRPYFEEQLDQEVRRLRRSKEQSVLMYIDLDRFKYINDTLGHTAGDNLLIEISRQLRKRTRDTDILARLGGDEFAVIMRNIEHESIEEAAEGLRELLAGCNFNYKGKNYKINGSVGVAVIDTSVVDPGEVLANADFACNIAKTKGRNQIHIYRYSNDDRSIMDLDLGWSARLREALQDNLFVLCYHPIVDLACCDQAGLPDTNGQLWESWKNSGEPQRYEALVRLSGSQGELISPHAFIPTAERFNLMMDIDFSILENAIEHLARISRNQRAEFSINLSGHSMSSAKLVDHIIQLLDKYRVGADQLILEITETSAIENMEMARNIISELRRMGCRFALDDFGTGFSSFSQLKHLPVDYLKIDGSFVQGINNDHIDHAMVVSINDIAHSLKMKTIAEYVENREIFLTLKKIGVDYAQGNYIAKPLQEHLLFRGGSRPVTRTGS